MGRLDRAKSFVNDRPIAIGLITGGVLLLTGLPITASISTLFIGSGTANATAKFIAAKISHLIWDKELPKGTLRFTDKDDDVLFEFQEKLQSKSIVVKIPATNGHAAETYKVNQDALGAYLLYRKALVQSYGQKPDLAPDIKKPTQSRTPELDGDANYESFVAKANLNASEKGLDQYSIAVSIDTVQRLQDDAKEHLKSFIAYENVNGFKEKLGFVLFQEKEIDGKPVVYIAEAAVSKPGASIGRRLMECVLAHFPRGTEFQILTRKFNTEAKDLYGERLEFEPLAKEEIAKLDYDPEKYIGFKHMSKQEELDAIKSKQTSSDARQRTHKKLYV